MGGCSKRSSRSRFFALRERRIAAFIALPLARRLLIPVKGGVMRYIVAWLLGVPLSVIVLWYLVGHAACG